MYIFATLDWRLYRYNVLPKNNNIDNLQSSNYLPIVQKSSTCLPKANEPMFKSCAFQGFSFDRRLDPTLQFLCIFHQEGVSLSSGDANLNICLEKHS
jgi:hypothetical protein